MRANESEPGDPPSTRIVDVGMDVAQFGVAREDGTGAGGCLQYADGRGVLPHAKRMGAFVFGQEGVLHGPVTGGQLPPP